jgi:predicted DNA-binding transcriptional regulator YafY
MIQASPRTPQLYTRNQLFRIQAIHNILQANRFPNCAILAERLEVSSRTIRRDLEFMALHLMLPLEYDPKQRGYYYSRYVDGLNTQCFNAREVRALHMTLPTIRDQANLVVLSGLLKKICHLGGIQSPDIAV